MHIPVLLKEVIEYLAPRPNENFIDCTFGGGRHSLAILEKTGPRGKVLGIDQNLQQIKQAQENFKSYGKRVILANDNFVNLKKIVAREKFQPVSGIIMDLGLSSWHFDESGQGFSFAKDEPLDMRLDQNSNLTAREIINSWPQEQIERILKEYGQERFSRNIAKNICLARTKRPIERTLQLVQIIENSVPGNYERGRINPATRTFLALRIATNRELENLSLALPLAQEVLKKDGRLVVISFNSQEDKIVKDFFREQQKSGNLKILTKKPVVPTTEEVINNHRARSAKLRAAIKI
jgi:16S rRNA (cytosine1402-N4)-methyltransferase